MMKSYCEEKEVILECYYNKILELIIKLFFDYYTKMVPISHGLTQQVDTDLMTKRPKS